MCLCVCMHVFVCESFYALHFHWHVDKFTEKPEKHCFTVAFGGTEM